MKKFVLAFNVVLVTYVLYVSIVDGPINISTVFFITLIAGLMLGIQTLIKKIKQLKSELLIVQQEIPIYKSLLLTGDEFWIVFDACGYSTDISDGLKNILNIFSMNITIGHFINLLQNITDCKELNIAMDKFMTYGTELDIELKLEKKKFNLIGVRSAIKGVILDTFVFKDISKYTNQITALLQNAEIVNSEKELMQNILDKLPIPVWFRNNNMKLSYCNTAYSEIVGESKACVIQDNIPLINGNLFGEGDSLTKNVHKTGKAQHIEQNLIVDGNKIKLFVEEILNNDMSTIGYAIDKTSEDIAVRNLDRYIQAQAEILEMISSAIAIFSADMKLIYFNSSYQKLTGIDGSLLHTKPKFGAILDDLRLRKKIPDTVDFAKYKKEKLNLFISTFQSNQEFEYLPDGRSIKLTTYPNPYGGIVFIYEDVTDGLLLERKNNSLLEVQKETIDNLYEGTIVYGSDNRVKIANPAFKRLWEIGNYVNLESLHISDILELMKSKMNYGDNWNFYKENVISNLTDRIAKTGKIFRIDQVVINFSYIPLSDGTHVHSYIDTTDSWKVEKALYERNTALQESDRIKSMFITSISNELVRPIERIVAVTSSIEGEKSDIIKSHSQELLTMIDDLKDFISIDTGMTTITNELINFNTLIREAIRLISSKFFCKKVVLENKLSDDIQIVGDFKRLKQVLMNLITNANSNSISDVIKVYSYTEANNIVIHVEGVKIISDIEGSEPCNNLFPNITHIIELHGGKVLAPNSKRDFQFIIPIHFITESIINSKEKDIA